MSPQSGGVFSTIFCRAGNTLNKPLEIRCIDFRPYAVSLLKTLSASARKTNILSISVLTKLFASRYYFVKEHNLFNSCRRQLYSGKLHSQIICIFAAQNKAHGREQNTYRNRDSSQEHRQPLPAVGAAAVETAERSGQRQAASERLYGHQSGGGRRPRGILRAGRCRRKSHGRGHHHQGPPAEELHHPQVHQPLPPVSHPRLQHRHRLPHRHPRLPRDQMAIHRPNGHSSTASWSPARPTKSPSRYYSTRPTSTSPKNCKQKANSSTASTPTPATP